MPRKKKSKGPLVPPIGDFGQSERSSTQKNRLELYQKWQKRVEHAKKIRKKWEEDFNVKECEKFIIGKQVGTRSKDPVFNHVLATLKVIKPSIFYKDPKFFVRPKPGTSSSVNERSAAIGEAVLESIGQQDNNLKNAGALALWQNFTRIGVIKISYNPRMIKNPAAGEPIYLTTAEGEPVLDENKQPIPLTDPATGEPILEPEEIIKDEVYRYEWVDAANMLLPDEGPDMSKWSWIGEEVIVPLEEAKEDSRFDKNLRSALVSNVSFEKAKRKISSYSIHEQLEEMLCYYECYDIKEKKVYIWADGQNFDDFLYEGDLQKGIEDHPYAILLGFTPIIGPEPSPWPLPEVYPWLDIQREYNIRRKQITEGAKRSARKGVYDEGTFPNPDEAVKLLQSPDDMVFAKVNPGKIPTMLESPDLNPSIYKDVPLLFNDWRIITGQTGARLADPDAETATEASFVERAGNLRDADKLDAVNDWLTCAGKKMFQLVKATLTLDLWIKIRGFNDTEFKKYVERVYGLPAEMIEFLPGLKDLFKERYGQENWLQVRREDLAFEADVSVVPGSFRPRNLDIERDQWMKFLQVIGQFPQLALSRELLRETASKFEYISERMLDELTALAQKMIQVQAEKAGRTQGGENNMGNDAQRAMAGMMNAIGMA